MKTATPDVLAERVRTGAEYADACWDAWWQNVDPDRLDMEDATTCVLGQLFWTRMVDAEEYVDVPMWSDLARYAFEGAEGVDGQPCEYAVDLGFDSPVGTHDQLTDLWRAEITRRRATA